MYFLLMNKNTKVHLFFSFDHIHNYLIRKKPTFPNCLDKEKNYAFSSILEQGDVILLADGGHGFKMLEDSEIIEIKQGPYSGDKDKVRFTSVSEDQILIK